MCPGAGIAAAVHGSGATLWLLSLVRLAVGMAWLGPPEPASLRLGAAAKDVLAGAGLLVVGSIVWLLVVGPAWPAPDLLA